MNGSDKKAWLDRAISVGITIVGVIFAGIFTATYAIGKFEEEFESSLEVTKLHGESIAELKRFDAGKGEVLTAHTVQLTALAREDQRLAGDIASARIASQTSDIALREEISERLDLIIHFLESRK
ncbi:hypothetical protein N8Z76_00380 [Gammaproteobacteria bacterium]|nr:hypothetical protein [Gammaproteobacteria bacterium]